MIYELNHFGIFTRDMEDSLAFYLTLDAEVVFDHTIAGPDVRIVYLQLAESMIELICNPNPPAGWRFGVDHLGFMTDDLDGDYARLLAAGCVESEAPKRAGTGVGRLAFVSREGARIELLQRDVDFRRPVRTDGIVKGFDHFAYTVSDLGAAAEFFANVVGMQPVVDLVVDGTPIRTFFELRDDRLGLGEPANARSSGTFPYFALRVEDVDAALAELARRGLTDLGPAADSRAGIGRTALIEGPDGVRIELLDRPALSPTTYEGVSVGATR